MSTKILKNTTISDIELKVTGFTILASSSYAIEVSEYRFWATPDAIAEITPFINSGAIVVNDGIRDLSAVEGINHLKYPDFATSQRFESEPERSNSMNSKTTQLAIEEARPDIEKDGALVEADVDIINFEGTNVSVVDSGDKKVTVRVIDAISDGMYQVECFFLPGCNRLYHDQAELLADQDFCLIIMESC
jgi:hypothetical protein